MAAAVSDFMAARASSTAGSAAHLSFCALRIAATAPLSTAALGEAGEKGASGPPAAGEDSPTAVAVAEAAVAAMPVIVVVAAVAGALRRLSDWLRSSRAAALPGTGSVDTSAPRSGVAGSAADAPPGPRGGGDCGGDGEVEEVRDDVEAVGDETAGADEDDSGAVGADGTEGVAVAGGGRGCSGAAALFELYEGGGVAVADVTAGPGTVGEDVKVVGVAAVRTAAGEAATAAAGRGGATGFDGAGRCCGC